MKSRTTPLAGLPELVRELEARIQRHPTYPDFRNLRGVARAYAGDLDAALVDLHAALRHNPKYTTALVNLGWLHFRRGEPEQLRSILAESRSQSLAASSRAHLHVLEALCSEGRDAALGRLDSLAPTAAPPAAAWLELDRLWLLWQGERWEGVETQLARILAWVPGAAANFRTAGLLRPGTGGRQAFATWGACFQGNPHVACLLRECARIQAPGGDGMTWGDLLHWSAALSLDLCEYWMAVGAQHDLEGHDAEAEVAFRRAVDCDPDRPQPYIKLGVLCAAFGRPRQAVAALERAAQLAPRYADVRYLLGLLHEDLGGLEQAEAEYRHALGIHPHYTMAQLALGSLLEAERRDAEALPLLEGVRAAGLVSADVELRLAALYRRLGRPAEARRARSRARRRAVPGD